MNKTPGQKILDVLAFGAKTKEDIRLALDIEQSVVNGALLGLIQEEKVSWGTGMFFLPKMKPPAKPKENKYEKFLTVLLQEGPMKKLEIINHIYDRFDVPLDKVQSLFRDMMDRGVIEWNKQGLVNLRNDECETPPTIEIYKYELVFSSKNMFHYAENVEDITTSLREAAYEIETMKKEGIEICIDNIGEGEVYAWTNDDKLAARWGMNEVKE